MIPLWKQDRVIIFLSFKLFIFLKRNRKRKPKACSLLLHWRPTVGSVFFLNGGGGGEGHLFLFLAKETAMVRSVFKEIKIIIWLLSPSLQPQYRNPEAHCPLTWKLSLGPELGTGPLCPAGSSEGQTMAENVASLWFQEPKEMSVASGKKYDLL